MKNLNAVDFSKLLVQIGACKDASEWAEGKDLRTVWSTCHRGDWMLWLAAKYGDAPRKTRVTIACDCAESALKYVPENEKRPAECLATIRRWLKDKATIEEVNAAARAARAAGADAADAANAAARAREQSLRFSADVCRKYIQIEDDPQ